MKQVIKTAALLMGLTSIWFYQERRLQMTENSYYMAFCRAFALENMALGSFDPNEISCEIINHDILIKFSVIKSSDIKLSCAPSEGFWRNARLNHCGFY